ncbi:MAG: energy transducer TonB [bacterium]
MKSLGKNGCDEAAINALKSVKWQPAVKDGKPVEVWVAVPVVFKLK